MWKEKPAEKNLILAGFKPMTSRLAGRAQTAELQHLPVKCLKLKKGPVVNDMKVLRLCIFKSINSSLF